MENEMTPAQSLKLIEDMIGQAKRSFHRQSYYFLLWGVLLIVAMAVNYACAMRHNPYGGYIWPAIGILGGFLSFMHGSREGRKTQVSTMMDRVMTWLWTAFMVTLLIQMIASGIAEHTTSIGAVLALTGLPTFVTGQLVRFRPLILGGILFWVLGAVSYFVTVDVQPWLYMGGMLFGYVIPGLMLKRQEDVLRAA